MPDDRSIAQRLKAFRGSKTQMFWFGAACAVATIVVGFAWGGWVTGGTAREMATNSAAGARADLAAAICVHQFSLGPDATAKLASLKGTESWKRSEFIEKGGWVALPGMEKPVKGAADLCARQLMEAGLPPPMKAAGTAG
jgi:hypothetical protein